MTRELREIWTCDGCGLKETMPAPAGDTVTQMPAGWSSWTATDRARHRPELRPGDPAHRTDSSVMLHTHRPECAKVAFANFVDDSIRADAADA